MEHATIAPKLLQSPGVEIGAFTSPIPGIQPIYVDRFSEYANQPTMAEYYGDSADLPFVDSSLNYVASSHVIEHVANPLAALLEWYRVLKDGGVIYMVVPDRRLTFDRFRALTSVQHMVNDYINGVGQSDGTHVQEYVYGVDWAEFSPATAADRIEDERQSLFDLYSGAVTVKSEINIHFHTFESASMVELLNRSNDVLPLAGGAITVERVEEGFPASHPNGFLVVARVAKPVSLRSNLAASEVLKPDARKIERCISGADATTALQHDFSEARYLELNPDVAAAVADGLCRSGYDHYLAFGKAEGRAWI